MNTNNITEVNQNPDFALCDSSTKALLSDAFKLWFIGFLKLTLLIPNKEANWIYSSFKKLVDMEPISESELKEIENIILDNSYLYDQEEYLRKNLIIPETVDYHNISAIKIKEIFIGFIIKAKINNIINKELRADDSYALKKDDILEENDKERWIKMLENESLYMYKLWERFFIIYKDPKLKIEYDDIIYDVRYWYKLIKWDFIWILSSEWEEIVSCTNTNLIYDERYWYIYKQWNYWGASNEKWKEIIPCIYDRVRFENWYFSIEKEDKKWIIYTDWNIVIEPVYDEINYVSRVWFNVKKRKLHWFYDLDWDKLFDNLTNEVRYIKWIWFIIDNWEKKWIFNLDFEQKVAHILDEVIYDENIWFKVKQWWKWWVIGKDFKIILECNYQYDDISYEDSKKGWIIRAKRQLMWDKKIKIKS